MERNGVQLAVASRKHPGRVVPTVHVVDETSVRPERVLEAARDFSERRAELWPDVHVEHLEIHQVGDTFAEVTEGNPYPIGVVWERLRYDWSRPGSVKGTVTDSNIFRPGSTWEIRATPSNGGSRVEVIGVRNGKGFKGGLIGILIRMGIAKPIVASHLRHFLSKVEEQDSDPLNLVQPARNPRRATMTLRKPDRIETREVDQKGGTRS